MTSFSPEAHAFSRVTAIGLLGVKLRVIKSYATSFSTCVFRMENLYYTTRITGPTFTVCALFHSFTIFSILLIKSFEVYGSVFEE